MGEQWLNDVMAALRQAGWSVEAGYPGRGSIPVEGAVAVVNLSKGDTRQMYVGITVGVLVPRSQGLAQCQRLAAQAAVLLSGVGGDWSFSGWEYDSRLDCFQVDVQGEARFSNQEGQEIQVQGYEIALDGEVQQWVTEFTARKNGQRRMLRPHAQRVPEGITPPMGGWSIELEQLIPLGVAEPEETADGFTLTARSGDRGVKYLQCCWGEYESHHMDSGIRIIRRGFALEREEV